MRPGYASNRGLQIPPHRTAPRRTASASLQLAVAVAAPEHACTHLALLIARAAQRAPISVSRWPMRRCRASERARTDIHAGPKHTEPERTAAHNERRPTADRWDHREGTKANKRTRSRSAARARWRRAPATAANIAPPPRTGNLAQALSHEARPRVAARLEWALGPAQADGALTFGLRSRWYWLRKSTPSAKVQPSSRPWISGSCGQHQLHRRVTA